MQYEEQILSIREWEEKSKGKREKRWRCFYPIRNNLFVESTFICLWNPHLSQEQCYANSLSPYLQNSLSFSSCKYKTCSSILKCYWWCSDSWSLEYEAVINHITQQVLKTCKITLLVMKSSKLCFMILIWKKMTRKKWMEI